MKNLKYFLSLFLVTLLIGCADDEGTGFLDNAGAPTNISALFTITQDNSGKVTIRPNGEGVTNYDIYFGDATVEPANLAPGETVEHVYAEGVYTVRVVGIGINGSQTEITQQLTVSFLAPTNLAVNITPESGNPYQINVTAEAQLETYFEIYFGEDINEVPVQFNEGQTISHTYATIGTYEVRVIAYSGGAATTEYTQNVTIFDPLLLPITFESPTLNYAFGDFGNASSSVVNNPMISASNTSSKVGKLTKNNGAEVWAGTTLALDQPIDFSTLNKISVKTFSPVVGAVVKLKLENLADANINTEIDMVTTVANDWETLVFDFGAINNANNYQRIALFFDFGNNGNGASYYFDDIKLTDGQAVIEMPLTFENAALTYTFTNFGGAIATTIANPHIAGINTSATVGALTKGSGSEVWAGSYITLADPIDFSAFQKIKMKVWSPQSGISVLMKLENADASQTTEIPVTNSVANGWEELTFDFTGINSANNYVKIVVFFDFGVNGTGATYYFDDIKLSN